MRILSGEKQLLDKIFNCLNESKTKNAYLSLEINPNNLN